MPLRPRLSLLALVALAWIAAACATPGGGAASIGATYLEAERYQDAAREYELAVRERPRDAELRMQAARAQAGAGHTDLAIGHLESALELDPRNPEIWLQLGLLEQQRNNMPDAYVAFRRATQLDPDEMRAAAGLALCAEALGFSEEAEQAYARWAELEREAGITPN